LCCGRRLEEERRRAEELEQQRREEEELRLAEEARRQEQERYLRAVEEQERKRQEEEERLELERREVSDVRCCNVDIVLNTGGNISCSACFLFLKLFVFTTNKFILVESTFTVNFISYNQLHLLLTVPRTGRRSDVFILRIVVLKTFWS